MTLTQLRTFLAVAEAGSIRAAAERLLVAQPSVSAAVSSLERELGVSLLARQGRGIRLTPAGVAFAESVKESLGLLDRGARAARAIEAPGQGEVRITSVTTAAERLLLPLIATFKALHPGAGVTVEVGNRTSVWESLRNHEADVVVAGRPPPGVPALVLATAENSLVLVRPTAARQLRVPELAGTTWLLREEGSGTREATEELLAELGIRPQTMILGSNGAIERAVAEGLGVALISRHAVAGSLHAGSVAVVRCPRTPMERPFHIVSHRGQALSPTAALLVRSMAAAADAAGASSASSAAGGKDEGGASNSRVVLTKEGREATRRYGGAGER